MRSLAQWCGRFSPIVGIEQGDAPQCLLLDVTGLAHLFGGEDALAAEIVHAFARRKLSVRIAIADTIGAAWAVAHYAACGFAILPPGQTLVVLRPMPIEALRLPGKTVDLLHQLGVFRVDQLEALPREELSSRFGPELLRRWDQAVGQLAEPVPACPPTPQWLARWSLEHPTTRRETIEAVLNELIAQVAEQLAESGRGALRLECRLQCRPEGTLPIVVGLFEPTASAEHLFPLVCVQLERLRLRAPVAAICVEASATATLEHRQRELFCDGDVSRHGQPRHLASLVDRLSSRLGSDAVVRPRLIADAQPELAWRGDPLADGRRRRRKQPAPEELPPRPLRLFPRPVPLVATFVVPQGVPSRFQFRGRQHQVAQSWGPERIETGWWRRRRARSPVARDYYHVATTTGRRYWLFRRLNDGRWFLHGVFE
ncbi:MAG: DNA polymerase Y family protein [Candidatus Nealsonbacteria bacterium]|nr:DNA polymerase Y family protein [Candidatus Nealsonbacteria bacterium]